LIEKFDPAELHRFEQAREHSVDLLKKWLVAYKFRNWGRTRTRKLKVTSAMKTARAKKIATMLNDTKRWRSHGRGLSMAVLENDCDLMIDDFGKIPELNQEVRGYYRLLQDYMMRRSHQIVVQTKHKYLAM
jgi:hypothetical protein